MVALELDQREPGGGLVPALRRHLVAPRVVLERLLDARAAVDEPARPRPADAVAEQQVQAPAHLVDEVVHVALMAAVVVAEEDDALLVVEEEPVRKVDRL